MKQFKKLALAIAGLWCCMVVSVYGFKVDGIHYKIISEDDLTVQVVGNNLSSGTSNLYKGNIKIPSTVTYGGVTYTVTSIADYTFNFCPLIESLYISKNVIEIGEKFFNESHNELMKLEVENGNPVYDSRNNCNAIIETATNKLVCGSKNTIIPESVTSIGTFAFSDCSGLTSINIPESVTSIGEFAFSGCSGLTSINIPESVTSIGEFAFFGCGGLTSINIPESVTSIGESAFSYCKNVKFISIGKGIVELGNNAFNECGGELIINSNIPSTKLDGSVYRGAFAHTRFSKIIIGDDVTSIGEGAFASYYRDEYYKEGKQALSTLIIGANVNSIGSSAFRDYDIGKTIWKGGEYNGRRIGKINYTSNSKYSSLYSDIKVYPMLSSMFEIDGITYVPTSISERTCDVIDCVNDSLKSTVEIGETVSFKNSSFKVMDINPYTFYKNANLKSISLNNQGTIGKYALSGCSSLSEIELGNSITSIGDYALSGCSSLSEIKLGNEINSIGEYVFENCSSLTNFILPAATLNIGKSLFSGCNALHSLSVDANNTIYDSRDNCNAIVEKATNKIVASCNYTVIPNSITSIGDYAFEGCQELSTISVPQSVMSVGDYAFSGCTKLANVIIEDRSEALTLGSKGYSALFSDCPLDSVYIGGKITYDTSKANSPFYKNASLRTVAITDKEDKIYDYEFSGCLALKNVTIGNGVTSIGSYAFSGCSLLESFSFGSSMQFIGESAFSGCGSITKIVSSAVNPPVCGTSALDGINKWDCVLRVPASYMKAYQEADQWKEFLFIEDVVKVERYALKFIIDGEVYHTDSLAFSSAIVLPETPVKEGYTFGGWSEVPATMPIFDVTVEGTFTANKYNVVYKIDGVEYTTTEVSYGDSVILVDTPEKEGHTFSGWSEAPATMPAGDITVNGSFKTNKYLVTFKIGEEVISADSLEYNTAVTAPEAPAKEGYTFSGWGEVADVVPAHDLAYEGSYTVNSYQLIYVVDGETIETVSVEYGTAIMLKDAPIKEGYIFSGWSEVPETMPAEDVTVEGAFTVNGIESVIANNRVDVYNLNGVMIKSQIPVEALEEELSSGIYIINGKKFVVK